VAPMYECWDPPDHFTTLAATENFIGNFCSASTPCFLRASERILEVRLPLHRRLLNQICPIAKVLPVLGPHCSGLAVELPPQRIPSLWKMAPERLAANQPKVLMSFEQNIGDHHGFRSQAIKSFAHFLDVISH
jgi:hypothetical protein